jgi:hypothetical protein
MAKAMPRAVESRPPLVQTMPPGVQASSTRAQAQPPANRSPQVVAEEDRFFARLVLEARPPAEARIR